MNTLQHQSSGRQGRGDSGHNNDVESPETACTAPGAPHTRDWGGSSSSTAGAMPRSGRLPSRSRRRPEVSPSAARRKSGAPHEAAMSDRPPEADAFEYEYPGASWLASRAIRQLEVVGGQAEELVAMVARRYGLSHAALNALAVVEGAGGPMPTGEISARMHITTGTMTSVLDTLERNGYIKRIADPNDRRRVLVDITPDAQSVLDEMLPEVQHVIAAALTHVDLSLIHI